MIFSGAYEPFGEISPMIVGRHVLYLGGGEARAEKIASQFRRLVVGNELGDGVP